MYDRLILWSPIAGTYEYNQFFNTYFQFLVTFQDELEKNPNVRDTISEIFQHFEACFNDLRETTDRTLRLDQFEAELKKLINSIHSSNTISY